MYIEESAIIFCTIAFVILVIYLIRSLNSAKKTLDSLQKQLEVSQHLTTDLQGKLKNLDSLFRAAALMGDVFEQKAAHYNKTWQHPPENRVAELLEWAALGIDLWQKTTRR